MKKKENDYHYSLEFMNDHLDFVEITNDHLNIFYQFKNACFKFYPLKIIYTDLSALELLKHEDI
jgi:hypothetical protein